MVPVRFVSMRRVPVRLAAAAAVSALEAGLDALS